jgi:hypothetical protein
MAEDSLGIPVPDQNRVDLDEAEARARIAEQASWPAELEETYQNLRRAKPERIINAANLGDLAFTDAGAKLTEMMQVLADLRLEEWTRIEPGLAGEIAGNSNALVNTLTQMAELRSSQPDVQAQRDSLSQQFEGQYLFFVYRIWPLCFTARVRDIALRNPELLAAGLTPERLTELQTAFQRLEAEVEEFKSLSDLVSAQRQLVGEGGVSDLSAHFSTLVTTSKEAFGKWAASLAAAVVLGGAGAVAWVYLTRPGNNAGNAEIVTHIALDVLVVGLVVFLIRFFSIQTRAHRHVEFVSRNKANALSTFNLIVTGVEDPVVRAQVASALADAVFKSDDGIFSDASSDSVTIIERVIGAAAARPPA